MATTTCSGPGSVPELESREASALSGCGGHEGKGGGFFGISAHGFTEEHCVASFSPEADAGFRNSNRKLSYFRIKRYSARYFLGLNLSILLSSVCSVKLNIETVASRGFTVSLDDIIQSAKTVSGVVFVFRGGN